MRLLAPLGVTVLLALAACSSGGGGAGNAGGGAPGGGGGGGGGAGGPPGAGARAGGRGPTGPAEVSYVVLSPQSAALKVELPGRTVAVRVAQVRPQVTGIVQQRLFTEGSTVRAGQPLYQLDPGVYRATRDSAAAALAKSKATLRTVQLRAERYTKLAASGVISQQDRDDITAQLGQAEADVGTTTAALQAADINLAYTRIVAPISGRIATSDVTEGALVTANQAAALTSIQQLDPMYVDFTQSADEVLRLQKRFDSGELKRAANNRAQVHIVLGDGSPYPQPGALEVTGVSVSQDTGAITLRAVVPNSAGRLLPGMFVRVTLDQATTDKAILAPQRAVMRDANGEPYVFVLAEGDKAARRPIRVASESGNDWIVTAGLSAGDKLIVDGIQRVRDGETVRVAAGGNSSGGPDARGAGGPARGATGMSGTGGAAGTAR